VNPFGIFGIFEIIEIIGKQKLVASRRNGAD